MLIHELDPIHDLAALITLQTEAQEYWLLADGQCNPAQKAAEFFTDTSFELGPLATQVRETEVCDHFRPLGAAK